MSELRSWCLTVTFVIHGYFCECMAGMELWKHCLLGLWLYCIVFLEACLVVDPCKRPPVNEIIAHLYSVAQQLNEDLNSEPVS